MPAALALGKLKLALHHLSKEIPADDTYRADWLDWQLILSAVKDLELTTAA